MSSSESENQKQPSGNDDRLRKNFARADRKTGEIADNRDPQVESRRRFVSGKNLLGWWRDWGREHLATPDVAVPLVNSVGMRPGFLSHVSKAAMACQWDVYLNHGQYPSGMEEALNALEQIEDWEQQLSFFRTDSEVSKVNQLAASRPVKISDALWQILQLSYGLWELTEGAFDLTSSSLSECWGFLKREGRMPDDREIAVSLEPVGMDKIHLNPVERTVSFDDERTKINLGGIGKGWTLDLISQRLVENQINDFIFHGGQSSVLARGSKLNTQSIQKTGQNPVERRLPENGADAGEVAELDGWEVGVSHPLFPDRQLGIVRLCNQSLGTSGSGRQFFHYRGQRLSHILDPRTGRPAQGVLSATVLAPTAAQADALGTACFVLGPTGCEKLVEKIPELAILLVVPDPRGGRVITMGGMDQYWQPHCR